MLDALKRLLENPYPLRYVLAQRMAAARDGYTRRHYRHIVSAAADEALKLGVPRISVLEFGVAGGNGLIEFERVCARVERETGIVCEIYGFDTGKGLPPPVDYRDLPHLWQPGFFAMDEAKLRARLTRSELVLGDVADTAPAFLARADVAPIGAIAFDLDYYSSTVSAFAVLDGPSERYLPRTHCYFDDIDSIDDIGVNLAIAEFNAAHARRKLGNPRSLRSRRETRDWGWRIYEAHDFDHPLYCKPLVKDDQLPLD